MLKQEMKHEMENCIYSFGRISIPILKFALVFHRELLLQLLARHIKEFRNKHTFLCNCF